MKTIGVVVAKGGTGKSSIASNLAHALSRYGCSVLVDLDPQGNASSYLVGDDIKNELVDVLDESATLADSLVADSDAFSILPTKPNSRLKLFGETQLTTQPFIFQELRDLLRDDFSFDYCVFDMGPGLNTLERSALLACDEVITPILPESFSFDGIATFRDELAKIKKNFRVEVEFSKVAVNRFNRTYGVHKRYLEALHRVNGYSFYPFPQDTKLTESQEMRTPILEYAKESKFAESILNLAEVLR